MNLTEHNNNNNNNFRDSNRRRLVRGTTRGRWSQTFSPEASTELISVTAVHCRGHGFITLMTPPTKTMGSSFCVADDQSRWMLDGIGQSRQDPFPGSVSTTCQNFLPSPGCPGSRRRTTCRQTTTGWRDTSTKSDSYKLKIRG